MTFDKRADDNGKESVYVTLARIDENIKTIKDGAAIVRNDFEQHKINDTNEFNNIHKTIWFASGIVSAVVFVINLPFLVNLFKH